MARNSKTGRLIPDYSGYPEDVQRILIDADEIEGDLRATIEHMKECINEQADGLRVQGREIVKLNRDKLELEDARGAVDLRPVFLMELVKMYPEIGKLIEANGVLWGGAGPIWKNEGPDITPGCWATELFEWCYPQVDDLPGSDEDPDQEEYITGLEGFESDLSTAIDDGVEANRRNASTTEAGRKVLAEDPPKE